MRLGPTMGLAERLVELLQPCREGLLLSSQVHWRRVQNMVELPAETLLQMMAATLPAAVPLMLPARPDMSVAARVPPPSRSPL